MAKEKRLMLTHIQGMEGEKFLRLLDLCDRVSDANKIALRKHYVEGHTVANLVDLGLITSANWARVIQSVERKKLQVEAYITAK